ncbi:MAG TPA: DUF72 domain-containing protein, partial [Sphingomonas sp.]|nr:DUF72 domain-containing protein [Sphingomonas sp.]
PPTKRFDPDDLGAFLALLPSSRDGLPLVHVLDVRHESFRDPAFIALARGAGVSVVHTDCPDFPAIGDVCGPVRYARLMNAREEEPTGYSAAEIDRWAAEAKHWARGETGGAFPAAAPDEPSDSTPRDVFLFYINGAKVRAPAAAAATIERLRTFTIKVKRP